MDLSTRPYDETHRSLVWHGTQACHAPRLSATAGQPPRTSAWHYGINRHAVEKAICASSRVNLSGSVYTSEGQPVYQGGIPGPARKQMSNCAIEVAPHLKVLVADKEQTFSRRIVNILSIIGFNNIILNSDPHECFRLADVKMLDIAFVDMDATYDLFWKNADQLDILIVGMTYDKNARTWMSAIRRGADAILLKQYHPELLRPMLSQLVSSPRAWRGRLVQFPNTPSMRSLTRSNAHAGTDQPSSSSGETG